MTSADGGGRRRKGFPEDYPESYIRCRMHGHAWEASGEVESIPFYYVEHLYCLRCAKQRGKRYRKADGSPGGNSYVDPDGYHLDRMTTAERHAAHLRVVRNLFHEIRLRDRQLRAENGELAAEESEDE